MAISEQREKDLKNTIDLYLNFYKDKKKDRLDDFVEYAGFYHITNEKASEIIEKTTVTDKMKALCVLAGGDQVFNLINAGIKNIETFDINRLTEYYALGFKKRAIECLSYEEYIKLLSYYRGWYVKTHHNLQPEIEKYVIENMEEEYKWFWQQFKYALQQEGCNPSIFHLSIGSGEKNITKNIYAKDEETYKKFQKLLREAKITFTQSSITELPEKFGLYDLVYLSNILDYPRDFYGDKENPLYSALELLNRIYEQNLNCPGEILMTYLTGSFIPSLCKNKYYQNNFEEIILDSEREHAYKVLKK
ncbi:MAG: hypothetical protein IJO33_04545 [Bacilli bacterium]|nr:hypothetical protein [Bacilli bacterium]